MTAEYYVRSHRYDAEEIYYLFIPASFIELLNKSQIITVTCCIYMCLDVLGGDVTS